MLRSFWVRRASNETFTFIVAFPNEHVHQGKISCILFHALTVVTLLYCYGLMQHNLLENLPLLLRGIKADSTDLSVRISSRFCVLVSLTNTQNLSSYTQGISLFQRACTSLFRAQQLQPLEQLLMTLQSDRKRPNDAIFLASLLRNAEVFLQNFLDLSYRRFIAHFIVYLFPKPLSQILASNGEYGAAFHLLKFTGDGPNSTLLSKWNEHIHTATSAWKTDLERQSIRPPESLTLTSS